MNEGMVKWELLRYQTIKNRRAQEREPDTANAISQPFDHTEIPAIIRRCETGAVVAAGLRVFTEFVLKVTMALAPLVREKNTLDKWV